MMYTLFGGHGFIGSKLAQKLDSMNLEYFIPPRHGELDFSKNYGHAIYCIGLTSDFRNKPFETINGHICFLTHLLQKLKFQTFIYLSSTRVYSGLEQTDEYSSVTVNPSNPDHLYNISKLAGEAICHASSNKRRVHVVRLSNVVGDDWESGNFISAIVKEAISNQKITLRSSLDSKKDYITVDDVVDLLLKLTKEGRSKIFNFASSKNISNHEIIEVIKKHIQVTVEDKSEGLVKSFPVISNQRIVDELGYIPSDVLVYLDRLIFNYINN